MARPTFQRLSIGWNAEPNAPYPSVRTNGPTVALAFLLNPWLYKAAEREMGRLTFRDCTRWRLGPTNDEGWFRGQCRYSRIAPEWGEFYELLGDDDRRLAPTDWKLLASDHATARHFLFYFRDETFECLASAWEFDRGMALDRPP